MKTKTTLCVGILTAAYLTLFLSAPGFAPRVNAQTYHIQSQENAPFPYDPYDGAEPVVTIDAPNQIYEVQDNTSDWDALTAAQELDSMTMRTMSADSVDPGDGGDTNATFTSDFQPLVFGPNDLVIQITNVDMVNQQASLQLTNTIPDNHYQLLFTNTLGTNNTESWTLGEYVTGTEDTNITPFSTFSFGTNSRTFFRAHHANPVLAITAGPNAIEPNPGTGDPGQVGNFEIRSYYQLSNDLPVLYSISGTAQNGVDYSNVSGVITIPADGNFTNIFIQPINDGHVDGAEPVTMTLVQSNSYLIDPNASSATIFVEDSSTTVSVLPDSQDAIEPNGPPGEPAQTNQFRFHRDDERGLFPEMLAYLTIGGTASNGVDYAHLTNIVDFPDGVQDVFVTVNPLAQTNFDGTETVIVTLVPTNTYLIDTNSDNAATNNIFDSSTTVSIFRNQDAIETNATLGVGQPGIFVISRTDTRGDDGLPLTVNYLISGTASNGVDYQTLSGTVTLASFADSTNIFINTIEEDTIKPPESVTLTLVPNQNAYYFDSSHSNATVLIQQTAGFVTAATNIAEPNGLDYYEPSNCLIVSQNLTGGFLRVFTNVVTVSGHPFTNVLVTNWSGISDLQDEIYFTAPKIPAGVLTNSAGFTNGDLFFGSGTGIGWLSAGATRSNLDWCILTNSIENNALLLRGGVCVDQTGTFSNQLIIVTSDSDTGVSLKGVWRVDAHAHPTLIARINTEHLEGVTTLTNDVQKWGPWAGKIITGDESHQDPVTGNPDPVIYTIATNSAVTTNETMAMTPGGIAPEDFRVIPANQNLFISAVNNASIMELPSSYFTNNVGDLLITTAGERAPVSMFIVHWDSTGSNFVTTPVPVPDSVGGHIEGVTFAPLQLPAQ